jgi:MoxR-like ATPase
VRDYVLAVTAATRAHPAIALGCSPRGALALLRAAQAHALLTNRTFVTPDDVKALASPAMAHRLVLRPQPGVATGAEALIAEILAQAPVPMFEAPRADA